MADKQGLGFFDVGGPCPDLVVENGTLKADNTLETPTLISLHSNRRVDDEDLPAGIDTNEGWWGDQFSDADNDLIGSRIWTLSRGKIVDATINEFESSILECTDWMKEDGIADSIEVSAARTGDYEISGTLTITKPNGKNIPYKFIWDGQELKLQAA